MEHVIAERQRVATGRAQQLWDVHHILFVRIHYLQSTTTMTLQ